MQLSTQIKDNLTRSQKGSLNERDLGAKMISVSKQHEGDYQRNRERKKQQQIGMLRSVW